MTIWPRMPIYPTAYDGPCASGGLRWPVTCADSPSTDLRVADASVDLLVERVAQCDGSVVGLTDVNIGGQLDVVREFSPAPEHIPTGRAQRPGLG